MKLYLDLIWLLNFLFDFMILQLTAHFARHHVSRIRLIIGSFFASLLVFVVIYYPDAFLLTPVGKLIYSIIILMVTFLKTSFKQLIKLWGLFYFITFSLGGVLISLHFFFDYSFTMENATLVTDSTGYGTPISWLFVITLFPVTWMYTKRVIDDRSLKDLDLNQCIMCQIEFNNQCVTTEGFVDTANHLVDPISKTPVAIIDLFIIEQLFTEQEQAVLKTIQDNFNVDQLPEELKNKFHLIPFKGLKEKHGLILAFKPDRFIMNTDNGAIGLQKVFIGLQFTTFTSKNHYHCLVSPVMLNQMCLVS